MSFSDKDAMQMFGMTEENLKKMVEDARDNWLTTPSSLVISIASDVQEEISRGLDERARKNLNKIKYITHTYLENK